MKNSRLIQLLFTGFISLSCFEIANAGALIITPSNRTKGEAVQSIQLPSGAKIKYEYSDLKTKKLKSKTYEGFKIFSSKSKTVLATDPKAADDFNSAVLRETYNPVTKLLNISQLLWNAFPMDPKARFNAAYEIWARQIYNTRTNQTGESEETIYSKWIPDSYLKLSGFSKAKTPEAQYQTIIDKMIKDGVASRKIEEGLRSTNRLRGMIPMTAAANDQATDNVITALTSVSRCNANIGQQLRNKWDNQSFLFNEEASAFLNNGGQMTYSGISFFVPFTSPTLSEKILVSPFVFAKSDEFTNKLFQSFKTEDTKAMYFGDKNLNVDSIIGGKNFPWAGFALVHEFGHTLQTRSKDFPLVDRNFDVQSVQRIKDGKIKNLDPAFTKIAKSQFYDVYNSTIELSATLFALDAMVSCM